MTTLTFSLTSGTGPFDIDFTDGITNFSLTGVVNGGTFDVTPTTSVTYNFTSITDANTCVRATGFTGGAQVIVNPLPVVSFSGLATDYCETDGSITLTGSQAPGGTFTGNGISDLANGTATFSPSGAGVGVHSITYTFEDINTCTNSSVQSVNVDEEPVANAGAGGDECDLDFTFSAVPSVGIGTWSQISGSGTAFFSTASSPTSSVQMDVPCLIHSVQP